MLSDIENIEKTNDYGFSHYFDDFGYPFHKVDMILFEKAVEELILTNTIKKTKPKENTEGGFPTTQDNL